MSSSGRYLPISAHDHETARHEGARLSSWHWTGTRMDGNAGVVTLEMVTRVGEDVTVGPGQVEVTLPREEP